MRVRCAEGYFRRYFEKDSGQTFQLQKQEPPQTANANALVLHEGYWFRKSCLVMESYKCGRKMNNVGLASLPWGGLACFMLRAGGKDMTLQYGALKCTSCPA